MTKTTKKDDQELEELQKKIEELVAEKENWRNQYVRALADYQNLEKRSHDRIDEARRFAAEIVLERLLPVVDTFKKVKEYIKDPGLDLALKELDAVLQEQGVEMMTVLGQPFNPHEMECIEVIDGKDNEVVEEVLPGYRLREKILRVAQVKVGKENKTS